MKAKPLIITEDGFTLCKPEEATHLKLHLPGPIPIRIIPVQIKGTRRGTPNWTWNGDTERPTLKPSLLSDDGRHRCHTFVNDGKAQFLSDCSHDLAGQTVDLLEVD